MTEPSKTPRTDEEVKRGAMVGAVTGMEQAWEDMAALAKELETALTAARAEAEALRKDAERLKFQYSQYVKTCEAVGLGGVVSYEQWISAIDAARSERGKE